MQTRATAIVLAAILGSSSQAYAQSLRNSKGNEANARNQCARKFENAQFLLIGYQGEIYNNHRIHIDGSGNLTKVSNSGDILSGGGGPKSVSCYPEGRLGIQSTDDNYVNGKCSYSNGQYLGSYNSQEIHIEGKNLVKYYQSDWKDCNTGKFVWGSEPKVRVKKYAAPRPGYSYN